MKVIIANDWKKGFYNALEEYFGLPKDSITDVDESASEQGGCSTCYGGIDYEVTVYYVVDGKSYIKTYDGNLAYLISSL